MQKHHEQCTEWMKKSVQWEDKNNSWDNYSMTVAKAYLANNNEFDQCTLLFILAENSNEAGKGERSIAYLDQIEQLEEWKGFSQDDKVALHSYYKGCALRILKETDKAKSCLIKAAGMHNKSKKKKKKKMQVFVLKFL